MTDDPFRCICDPDDIFEPPDPRPVAVEGCPAHQARRAFQQIERRLWPTSDQPAERYPAGGCVLRDKTTCTLPPATCCDEGLAIRWPGEHKPVEGSDFMHPQWCGACDACGPAPTVCLACSYDTDGGPRDRPVDWPCAPHRARLAAESAEPAGLMRSRVARPSGGATCPPESWDHTHPDHNWWVDGASVCFDLACPDHPYGPPAAESTEVS